MDLNKLTQKAQDAILSAQSLARELNHQAVEPAHMLLALVNQTESLVPTLITQVAGSTDMLKLDLDRDLKGRSKVYGGTTAEPNLSRPAADVLEAAERYAKGMGDEYVSTEHILLGLADSSEGKRLAEYGLTKDAILKALRTLRGSQSVSSQNPESTFQALEKYGRDLTAMARQGKLDPVIGRDEEIRRVLQILSRRTKNNPILIGEPGTNLQIIIFAITSVLSLIGLRRIIKRKFFYSKEDKYNEVEDEFTGKEAFATMDFGPETKGKVEFKGTTWASESKSEIKEGQTVIIIEKDSFKLIVEPKK